MFEASSSSFMIEGSFLRSSTTVLRKKNSDFVTNSYDESMETSCEKS